MHRPQARRRGGSLQLAAGYVAVGVSAVVLLAASPRELGARAFGGFGLAWTITNVFGLGLAFPTEQLLSRRLNARLTQSKTSPVLLLAGAGILCIAAAYGLHLTSAGRTFDPFVPSVAIAVIGWVLAAAVRGRLAGSGDLVAYGRAVVSEAAIRIVLVGAASADRPHAGVLLGAAIGVPVIFSAATGSLHRIPEAPIQAGRVRRQRAGPTEHASFVVMALGYQACLNGPPLLLGLHAGVGGRVVGSFVATNTYYRASAVLIGGVVTHALVALSAAWGRRDLHEFQGAERLALRNLIAISAACLVGLMAASPLVLRAYYGRAVEVPSGVQFALAASSFAAGLAFLLAQTLLAAGRATQAASGWLLGAALSLGVFAFADRLDMTAAIGLVVGPLSTCSYLYLRRRVIIAQWKQTATMQPDMPGR